MKSRIIGVSTQMETFRYFYGVTLGELILQHTDNLSRTLQKSDISAAQGQEIAGLTVKTLQKIRTDESFVLEDYHQEGYYSRFTRATATSPEESAKEV